MELVLFFLLAIGIPCGAQLLLLRLTRRRGRVLRWVVPLAAIPWFVLAWQSAGGLFGGLAVLAYLPFGVCDLLGWALAWPVHLLLERRRQT